MSPYIEQLVNLVISEGVPVVTTGAQSPEKYIKRLKEAGIKVFPVVSSVVIAKRIQRFGVDGIIAEGMESGGHVGEETTMSLIPQMVKELEIPVIAAGGIASGNQLASCLAMGCAGVQIGTVLIATNECPVHKNYKEAIIKARDNDTTIILKNVSPVRVLKNRLAREYLDMERKNIKDPDLSKKESDALIKGILDGDIESGCLPIGQIAGLVKEIKPVKEVLDDIIKEAYSSVDRLNACIKLLDGGK